jgi:hypothetical protein
MSKVLAAFTACALSLVGLGVNSASYAASILDQLDGGELCPRPGRPVSQDRLARALIKAAKVPAYIVELARPGPLYDEYVQVLTADLCHGDPGQKDKCSGTDSIAQGALILGLNDTLRRAAGVNPGDFTLTLPKIKLRFRSTGKQVTELDVARYPLLALAPADSLAARVFMQSPQLYQISCASAPSGTPGAAGAPVPDAAADGRTAPLAALPKQVRIRAKPSDLFVGQDDAAFGGLPSASLAISDDWLAQKTSFDLHAAVGYQLPYWQSGPVSLASIPFARVDRDRVAKGSTVTSNVENYGVGLAESLNFPIAEKLYGNLTAVPQYVFSADADTSLFTGTVAFELQPLMPYFGYAAALPGWPDVQGTAYAQALYMYSEVNDPGLHPTLVANGAYSFAGFRIGGSLFDAKEGSILNGLSLPVDYAFLEGFSGNRDSLRLFTASLNYTFPKTKYLSIGVTYTDGNNLDTFERQKLLKATLGLKY